MFLKELIRKILINKTVNKNLVQPLIHIKKVFPEKYFSRIPVIGTFSFKNRDGKLFKMQSDGYDPGINKLFWTQGRGFEPNVINLLHTIADKSEIFFDIGANTGLITVQMALLPSAKQIYSFEPGPRAFNALNKNIEINSFRNCKIYQLGLAEKNDKMKFYIPNLEAIPSSASLHPEMYMDHHEIEINTMVFDDFVEKEDIKKIDVVKIDVEGTELNVLSGMKKTLQNHHPQIICEIIQRLGDIVGVYNLLKPFKYHFYEILDDRIQFIPDIHKYRRNKCRDFLLSTHTYGNMSTVNSI